MKANCIMFVVPGKPVAKARHRINLRTGHTYTPDDTKAYERLVKVVAKNALAKFPGDWQKRGVFQLYVHAYFPIPDSRPKEWKALAVDEKIVPATKPDWDNIGKIISDALNGILWHDDSMVAQAFVYKYYSEEPRVLVEVRDITDEKDRWVRKG